ncbi:MAG: hypothetical protein GY802_09440 [Gammaproteobacteria bacterium]|nr:hypothetical protein [Gammaproteobacteria bacterium]
METRRLKRRDLELPPIRVPRIASGAVASGALAIGALAIGALAIGALAIGRLSIRRAEAQELHFGKVKIDDLTVKRLHVVETTAEGGEQTAQESRSRKSAQDDKWSFCLTVGTLYPLNQERL